MGPLSFYKPPWGPGVSLTSTQMALELSLKTCWRGCLQASFPTVSRAAWVPGERGGLIPVLPGQASWPLLPGARSLSAVAACGLLELTPEPSFIVGLNCWSCFRV